MTDQQDQTTFAELTGVLRESGLSWVVDQVQDEIGTGRLELVPATSMPEEVDQASYLLSVEPRRQVGRRTEFLRSRPYTHGQRLRLLVEAISQAVGETVEMQDATVRNLKARFGCQAIRFADPLEQNDVQVEAISPLVTESLARLTAALERLRELSGD